MSVNTRYESTAMRKILIPVDGSESSQRAVQYAIQLVKSGASIEVHLLNVQFPIVSGDIRRFVTQAMIDGYHRAEGDEALKAARRALEDAGVRFESAIVVGHIAEAIAQYATKVQCDSIVMGTRGMGPMKNLVLGSVATQVIHGSDVPVTLVK